MMNEIDFILFSAYIQLYVKNRHVSEHGKN